MNEDSTPQKQSKYSEIDVSLMHVEEACSILEAVLDSLQGQPTSDNVETEQLDNNFIEVYDNISTRAYGISNRISSVTIKLQEMLI